MLHDAFWVIRRKQHWHDMWKPSLHNASVTWRENKICIEFSFSFHTFISKCFKFNLRTEWGQSVRSVKRTISMRFHSVGKWEVRDCQQLSQTSVCDAAPVHFFFFSFFLAVMLRQTQTSSLPWTPCVLEPALRFPLPHPSLLYLYLCCETHLISTPWTSSVWVCRKGDKS